MAFQSFSEIHVLRKCSTHKYIIYWFEQSSRASGICVIILTVHCVSGIYRINVFALRALTRVGAPIQRIT